MSEPHDRDTDIFKPDRDYSLLMSSLDVSVSKHLLDEHFTVIWANDRYYRMFGYTKEEYEALFHNQCDLYYRDAPDEWQALGEVVTGALSAGRKKYEYVCRMPHRDGRRLWIKLVGNITDETVRGYGVSYSVMTDITDQMQTQLEQSVTYNNLPGYIAKYLVTTDGYTLMKANPRFADVFGARKSLPMTLLRAQEGLAPLVERHETLRRGEPASFTIRTGNASGEDVFLRVAGECVDRVGGDPVYLFIFDDITQLTGQRIALEESNRELEKLAYIDSVTGGFNRTRFERVAGEAVRAAPAGTYSLVWLNLQKFQLINDLGGSGAGDRTLRYIYETLVPFMEEGEYLARTSADNFVLLLHTGDKEDIPGRLSAAAEQINRFNEEKNHKYILSFTAGIYDIDDPALSMTKIRDRAQIARKGIREVENARLCACRRYSEEEQARLVKEKDIENRMRDALEHKEFEVYLQPKLSLRENRVTGAEALVRWNDPQEGLIPPGSFIPLFEKNGFIVPLDLYVFEEVCRLLKKWLEDGREPVVVSVNMSRRHFVEQDCLDRYVEIRTRYGIPACLLELELTETMVFENPQAFTQVIEHIHQAGFLCSMDDFGSGYSSLNILKDLDVDVLKLDRAFFSAENMDDPRECTVVHSVVDLARDLQMHTVAEGVETKPQETFLRRTGCDMVQGFVFSRPLPVSEFEELVWPSR
ncbi:MAG: EAL domain-containing protein [Clostridiales bacterium]|nr:EAL domain-containing protein [Clostridiales bacterium]